MENREDLLQHYLQTREALLAAIDGMSDALMCETPPGEWSVKDQLMHISIWDEIRTEEVRRISGGHGSAWRMTSAQDEAFNELTLDLRRGLTAGQARWELETSRQRLLDAIASAAPRGLDASLYGEAGLRSSHEAIHTPWIKRWRAEKGV